MPIPTVIRKPGPFATLNARHPLNWGLTECCLFTPYYGTITSTTGLWRNLAYRGDKTFAAERSGLVEYGTTTGAPHPTGLGVNFQSGGNVIFTNTGGQNFLSPDGLKNNLSVIMLCRYPSAIQTIGSMMNGNSSQPELGGPFSSNGYGMYHANFAGGWLFWPAELRQATGRKDFMLLGWTVGYHIGGSVPIRLYYNGRKVAEALNAGGGDAIALWQGNVQFGGRGSVGNAAGEIVAAWVYRGRLLNDSEVAQFAISPFQMFTDHSPMNQPFNQGMFGHPLWGNFNISL